MQSPLQLLLDLFDEPKPAPAPKPSPAPDAGDLTHVPGEPFDRVLAPQSFRHPDANREIRLGDVLVAFEFRRARRKNIGFAVGPEGLVVSAPRWVPLGEVDQAVRSKTRIDSRSSRSLTSTRRSTLRRHASNENGNAYGAPKLSAIVATRSIERGSPAAKLRCMLSAPSGSTPNTSHRGASSFTADATPAHNPPPPIGTITASRFGTCSHSSTPTVAVPSAVARPSNG